MEYCRTSCLVSRIISRLPSQKVHNLEGRTRKSLSFVCISQLNHITGKMGMGKYQFDEISTADCTGVCQNYNFQCSQCENLIRMVTLSGMASTEIIRMT